MQIGKYSTIQIDWASSVNEKRNGYSFILVTDVDCALTFVSVGRFKRATKQARKKLVLIMEIG